MEAARGQKHPSEAENGMKEKKLVNNLDAAGRTSQILVHHKFG